MSNGSQKLSVELTNMTLLGARKLHGIREKGIKYWLELSGRGGDNP
jgi:hypothetical protein